MAQIRIGLALSGLLMGMNAYAQNLPVMPPTTPATQTVSTPKQPESPAQQQAKRAQVDLANGKLTVAADNSSLNQILREIARLTGMKITGGVTDERVFGSYGPDDPSVILATLIRGTGSNMMIVLDANQAPQELVLTPRAGGPTPPNPNASRDRGEEDLPPQRNQRFARPDGVNGPIMPPPQVPANQPQPNQFPQQAPEQTAPPPTNPSNDTTTQQSPNGVKTPQEIYDQLMKMQQQQQAQPK